VHCLPPRHRRAYPPQEASAHARPPRTAHPWLQHGSPPQSEQGVSREPIMAVNVDRMRPPGVAAKSPHRSRYYRSMHPRSVPEAVCKVCVMRGVCPGPIRSEPVRSPPHLPTPRTCVARTRLRLNAWGPIRNMLHGSCALINRASRQTRVGIPRSTPRSGQAHHEYLPLSQGEPVWAIPYPRGIRALFEPRAMRVSGRRHP
jgi:hypothetical protein